MKTQSVKRQAAVLTGANALTRALGFLLRVALGRLMGAEALGVMELGHSAHMLCVTPVTAGLPMAVSRLTALRRDGAALRAGRRLVLRVCAVLIPLWALLAPVVAGLLGDGRTLLSLWAFTPCIALLGLAAVYHGFCYGLGKAWPPALGTLTEQGVRLLLSVLLLTAFSGLSVSVRAALPGIAGALAAGAALGLMAWMLRREHAPSETSAEILERDVLRLAAPLTGVRMIQTLSRSLLAALLPRMLMRGGQTMQAATAGLGMLQGMILPALFLPGIFTGAVGMVGAPAIARRQGADMRRMALRLFAAALGCGLAGGAVLCFGAELLANTVYRLPALAGLFRAAAPLTLLLALHQSAGTLLAGLGQQRRTLLPALAEATVSLLLTARWAASPLGLYGAIYALTLGRAVSLLWELAEVLGAMEQADTHETKKEE